MDAGQKNWCETCKEFLVDYDHAKRCEDLDHHLTWKDPSQQPPLNNSGDTPL